MGQADEMPTLAEAMALTPREPFNPKRHPYTYAADLLREATQDPFGSLTQGCVLSRSQASAIRQVIAEAIGWPDDVLAEYLSAAYQKKHTTDFAAA